MELAVLCRCLEMSHAHDYFLYPRKRTAELAQKHELLEAVRVVIFSTPPLLLPFLGTIPCFKGIGSIGLSFG